MSGRLSNEQYKLEISDCYVIGDEYTKQIATVEFDWALKDMYNDIIKSLGGRAAEEI